MSGPQYRGGLHTRGVLRQQGTLQFHVQIFMGITTDSWPFGCHRCINRWSMHPVFNPLNEVDLVVKPENLPSTERKEYGEKKGRQGKAQQPFH